MMTVIVIVTAATLVLIPVFLFHLGPGRLFQVFREEERRKRPKQTDQNEGTDKVREKKSPAEQEPKHGRELDHQVGRCKHESEGNDQSRALFECASARGCGRV